MPQPGAARLHRLADELEESGLRLEGPENVRAALIEEIDHALRPDVHERRVGSWIDVVTASSAYGDAAVLEAMLEFAVHDLGSMGIGSLLIFRPGTDPGPPVEERLPPPPPLQIRRASHLAPLRHALAQVDGAAMFDAGGVLRLLGVRLVPSAAAESHVGAIGGTRHTSGRRYSYSDPLATVIAVSEDGPVSVLRNGDLLGRSHTDG